MILEIILSNHSKQKSANILQRLRFGGDDNFSGVTFEFFYSVLYTLYSLRFLNGRKRAFQSDKPFTVPFFHQKVFNFLLRRHKINAHEVNAFFLR